MSSHLLEPNTRSRLFGIAYRMLGSRGDAEDTVQDVFERWLTVDKSGIENPDAYLSTMTTRLCLDRLRSAQKRRETYPGPWLAEPIETSNDPATIVELSETLTLGFLHVLDTLTPTERAVHLLHTVFDVPYVEIAPMVDKTEPNCRKIAERARKRIAATAHQSWVPTSPQKESDQVGALVAAIFSQDIQAVTDLLTEDAIGLSDGGPNQRAARQPIVGQDRLARFLVGLGKKTNTVDAVTFTPLRVNNQPALSISMDGQRVSVAIFQVQPEGIDRVFIIVNPDKLSALDQ